MDIGFGDVVTPTPRELTFPALIDTVPQAEIKAYSLETVVAEKFHAMIVLSLANSRMKDFFDVYRILVTEWTMKFWRMPLNPLLQIGKPVIGRIIPCLPKSFSH